VTCQAVWLLEVHDLRAQDSRVLATPPQINWIEDPKLAVAEAQRQRRPMLLYVTADYCGYCRKMERDSWSNAGVANRVISSLFRLNSTLRNTSSWWPDLACEVTPQLLFLTLRASMCRQLKDSSARRSCLRLWRIAALNRIRGADRWSTISTSPHRKSFDGNEARCRSRRL